jgi:hypothetical protein
MCPCFVRWCAVPGNCGSVTGWCTHTTMARRPLRLQAGRQALPDCNLSVRTAGGWRRSVRTAGQAAAVAASPAAGARTRARYLGLCAHYGSIWFLHASLVQCRSEQVPGCVLVLVLHQLCTSSAVSLLVRGSSAAAAGKQATFISGNATAETPKLDLVLLDISCLTGRPLLHAARLTTKPLSGQPRLSRGYYLHIRKGQLEPRTPHYITFRVRYP